MKDKVIALNSGGFDSIVLIYHLKNSGLEPISLFFNYGQKNLEQERECARRVCDKLEIEHKEINIPPLDWSSSSLLSDGEDQYIELRNLIFLSYASSLAESLKIREVYSAIIDCKSNTYKDTSEDFINNAHDFFKSLDIGIYFPFMYRDKVWLAYEARKYGIQPDDYFTCNVPISNEGEVKPCGECGDCIVLGILEEQVLNDYIPIHAWFSGGLKPNDKFDKMFIENKVSELRVLHNNSCQFKCNHCFYGFEETKSPMYDLDEYIEMIDKIIDETSISNIHFSGKEPLYNKDIFKVCKHLKENHPKITYDLVTNGLNITKYLEDIKNSGVSKVMLSTDGILSDGKLRPESKYIEENIKLLQSIGIPLEIFVDITERNIHTILDDIKYLSEELSIKEILVRPVIPIGNGKDLTYITKLKSFADFYERLCEETEDLDAHISVGVNTGYVKYYLKDSSYGLIHEDIQYISKTTNDSMTPTVSLRPEYYCGVYESTLTLTPDGYLLGCATEVSSPHYDKLSSGRVTKDSDIRSLIKEGRLKTLKRMRNNVNEQGEYEIPSCYHSNYEIK